MKCVPLRGFVSKDNRPFQGLIIFRAPCASALRSLLSGRMVIHIDNEIWKPVDGYEKYFVSNLGRIKSLKHKKEKYLKAFPNNKGYYRVCLSDKGKAKHFLVSRLVAMAFCENDDP